MNSEARCSARNSRGQQCGRAPINGGTVCATHGGRAPQVKAAAARRAAAAKVESDAVTSLSRLGVEIDTTPEEAILRTVNIASRMVNYYSWAVEQLNLSRVMSVTRIEDRTGTDPARTQTVEAAPQLAEKQLSHWVRVLADVSGVAVRLRLDERRVKLAEQEGALVAGVLRATLGRMLTVVLAAAPRSAHDVIEAEWVQAVQTVVPEELRALGGAE